jgi:MOSC domain-containing protein YiiM
MVSLEQDDLPRDPRVLRYITDQSNLMFGVYATVVHPGTVRVGDEVRVASVG